jgi:hypothetical protein
MTVKETIPGGVNSDCPISHSRNATRKYLSFNQSVSHLVLEDYQTYRSRRRLTRVLANVLFPLFLGPLTTYTPGRSGFEILPRSMKMEASRALDHVEGRMKGYNSFAEFHTYPES